MDVEKLIQTIRMYKNQNPNGALFLKNETDFLNLINNGAEQISLNNDKPLFGKHNLKKYGHKAIYDGIDIFSYTSFEVTDSGEFGL